MSVVLPVLVRAIALLFLAAATGLPVQAQQQVEVDSRFADVNGTRLHYLVAGQGTPARNPAQQPGQRGPVGGVAGGDLDPGALACEVRGQGEGRTV